MPQNHLVIAQGITARLVIVTTGGNMNVVIHFTNAASVAVNVGLANTLFDSLKALWQANLASICPPATSFFALALRDINTAGNAEVSSTTPGVTGTATATDLLPKQIAACLTIRTTRAGRMFRGRMYWGGFSELANGADNHMTTAAKTALDTFSNGFLTAANVGGLTFGVAHRPTAFDPITGLPVSPGLGFITPANQVICRDNVWDNQRRRAR